MTNMSCSDLFPAFWGNASMQSLELAEDRTNQMLRRSISAWAFCSWCCSAPDFVPKVSTLKLVWKVYFQSPLCHVFNIFQLSHFLGPFFQILCQTLCTRDGMEPTGISGIRSVLPISCRLLCPLERLKHGSHIKKWWKGPVPGSHTKIEGTAPNIWPLKNGKCHDLQKVVSTLWVGEKPIRKGMSWDEVTSSWALLLDVQTSHGMPWRDGASKVGDVTLKQRELMMKNRDLTNKSG